METTTIDNETIDMREVGPDTDKPENESNGQAAEQPKKVGIFSKGGALVKKIFGKITIKKLVIAGVGVVIAYYVGGKLVKAIKVGTVKAPEIDATPVLPAAEAILKEIPDSLEDTAAALIDAGVEAAKAQDLAAEVQNTKNVVEAAGYTVEEMKVIA